MKLLSAIISAAMVLSAVPKSAENGNGKEPAQSDNKIAYSYEVNSDSKTATLTSAVLPAIQKEDVVPDVIDGYLVTEIGEKAYAGNFSLEKITIGKNIKKIGEKAFMSCNELKEVTFSEGVTEIPDDCFFSCPKLESVTLPTTLKTIGDEAFYGCDLLDIEIPPGVTSIGKNALGMEAASHDSGSTVVSGFLIKGKTGSAAEKYAAENGIDFIDMKNFIAGDVNGDNTADSADASAVLAEYAAVSTGAAVTFTKKQTIMGDMNGDGAVDSSDASVILEIYAKNSTGG